MILLGQSVQPSLFVRPVLPTECETQHGNGNTHSPRLGDKERSTGLRGVAQGRVNGEEDPISCRYLVVPNGFAFYLHQSDLVGGDSARCVFLRCF